MRQVAGEVHGHDTIRVTNVQLGLADGGQGRGHPPIDAARAPRPLRYSSGTRSTRRNKPHDPEFRWPLLPVLSVLLLASRTGRFEGWFATFSLIEARPHPPFARSWFVRRSNFSVLNSDDSRRALAHRDHRCAAPAVQNPRALAPPVSGPCSDCQLPFGPRARRSAPVDTHPAWIRYPAET